jgi:NADH:ubiquinone oxidoreductase subunit 4 (subunit M)
MTIPWLTVLALLPAVGSVVLIFTGVKAAKQVALVISLITLAFALIVAAQFKIGGRYAVGRAGAVDQAARGVLRARVWTASDLRWYC